MFSPVLSEAPMILKTNGPALRKFREGIIDQINTYRTSHCVEKLTLSSSLTDKAEKTADELCKSLVIGPNKSGQGIAVINYPNYDPFEAEKSYSNIRLSKN